MSVTQYFVLVAGGIAGVIAAIPYLLSANRALLEKAPITPRKLALISLVQGAIFVAIATALGLLAADANGLAIASEADALPLAVVCGAAVTLLMLLLENQVFRPHMPEALLELNNDIAAWKRAAASLYGGITEEILMRLLLMNGIIWLLSLVWQGAGVFWAANVLAALIFGIGHLPTVAGITRLTPILIVRTVMLNMLGGLIFGWLFWQHGLLAAMVAHLTADIILHVLAPLLNQSDTPAQAHS